MKERNFLPACVMACPTNALNFADQADTTGPVRQRFEEADQHSEDGESRAYRLLEELSTKPNVIYLKKVDLFPLKQTSSHGG
jgi:molybdopterin-containing oxidoreductase family iron-sulfur binding subunit